jgi:hypothetical protein
MDMSFNSLKKDREALRTNIRNCHVVSLDFKIKLLVWGLMGIRSKDR